MTNYLSIAFVWSMLVLLTSCNDTAYPAGERYYEAYCANCHMENGQGLNTLIPSIYQSPFLANNQSAFPCIIKKGIKSKVLGADTAQLSMPAHPILTDIEILNIINYINTAWGHQYPITTIGEVRSRLQHCN